MENHKIAMADKLKIIFWGTPGFAAIILNSLIQNDYQPAVVVTAPDKPVGRHAYRQAGKQILASSPVKELAVKYNIPVLQPENIKASLNLKSEILNLKPDLFIVAAYGQILPKEILAIPKFGSLNIHPSLLPRYRGASPIQAAILNGDIETGVTIILMDEKMDHGPIVAIRQWEIRNPTLRQDQGRSERSRGAKSEILNKELAELGAKLLIETLPKWLKGEIKAMPQDHAKATFTKILKKENGRIDWRKSAEKIERMIRAYNPWPGTFTLYKNKTFKIIKARLLHHTVGCAADNRSGIVFLTARKELAVNTNPGSIILEEVQLEGKNQMTAQEFLNGHSEVVGAILV